MQWQVLLDDKFLLQGEYSHIVQTLLLSSGCSRSPYSDLGGRL